MHAPKPTPVIRYTDPRGGSRLSDPVRNWGDVEKATAAARRGETATLVIVYAGTVHLNTIADGPHYPSRPVTWACECHRSDGRNGAHGQATTREGALTEAEHRHPYGCPWLYLPGPVPREQSAV